MKRLDCEMCGSTDLVKQDGVFVCQSCGCKYSVEEAKKMMIEGVVQVEGTVRIDNSDKEETYRNMAISAYNAGNTTEAYQYFLKVLEINPTDYQSIFYKGMCQGWETTLARPRVGEAVAAYHQVECHIPSEIAQTMKEVFISDLVRLMSAWFEKAQESFYDVDDWYTSNRDIYYRYKDVAEQIIKYVDSFMQTVVTSKSKELLKQVGELYCSACEAVCRYVFIWIDYSKESAICSGLSAQQKQPYLRDYDTMIFEIRKYYPDFRKPESKYGVIDRMSTPANISACSLQDSDRNFQKCLDADKAINQRLQQYNAEKVQREKAEKERTYWETHPDARETWSDLKSDLDDCTKSMNSTQSVKLSKEAAVKKHEDCIRELNTQIAQANDTIVKQRKKIFGKIKAQEVIDQMVTEVTALQKAIDNATLDLRNARAELEEANNQNNIAFQKFQSAKSAYDNFISSCGL